MTAATPPQSANATPGPAPSGDDHRILVLAETASNQRYLFDTNRLSQAVGASALTQWATTTWLTDALGALGLPEEWDEGRCVGPVILSSGSSLVLLEAPGGTVPTAARELATNVTRRALKDAPGLKLYVHHSEPFPWGTPGALHRANGEVHQRLAALRHELPAAEGRFQRLPFIDECPESGLPAARLDTVAAKKGSFAASTVAKAAAAHDGDKQLRQVSVQEAAGPAGRLPVAKSSDELDAASGPDAAEEGWVAVLHADGNGVGQLFLDFEGACGSIDNATYARALRDFSEALAAATRAAFATALEDLADQLDEAEPAGDLVRPIVLAGDDVTCMITGRRALRFAEVYLGAFLDLTRSDERITRLKGCEDGVGAGAGIAITKPRFPFWQAYRLAEDLCGSAKTAKARVEGPVLSLDVHVLGDSIVDGLDAIRDVSHQKVDATSHQRRLWGGPYLLGDIKSAPAWEAWVAAHRYDDLTGAIRQLAGTPDRTIASRAMHRVRDALFGPPEGVDVVLDDLGAATANAIAKVAGVPHTASETPGDKLFVSEGNSDGAHELTRLVDALALADLMVDVVEQTWGATSPATEGASVP